MKILILLLGLLGAVPFSANADEIKLTTDVWCPYACDSSSDKRGILVEVADRVFAKAGHAVVYKGTNWARAIADVRKGTFDGLIGTYSDAPDFVFPQESIMVSKMCFSVQEDDPWQFKEYDTLKGRKISVVKDYSYGALSIFSIF